MSTAVVIDGAFFLRRFRHSFPDLDEKNAEDIAKAVLGISTYHVGVRREEAALQSAGIAIKSGLREIPDLYRIFFYDCAPLIKRVHHPVSGRSLNLGQTPSAILRNDLHKLLRRTRKVALRLGRLNDELSAWRPKPDAVKRWLSEPAAFNPLDDDFEINTVQKGVDMRLGLDIASMAYKRQVDQIVLVAADADFVPATKLARREGIDVVLDPMWASAAPDLIDHVDGLRSCRITAKHVERG